MNIQSIAKTLSFVCLLVGLMGSAAMAEPTNRYVSLTGGDTPPYTDWTTAATSINAAVNLANGYAEGDTVLISTGLYVLSETVTVSNTIVRGFSGLPEDVVVSGSGARQCFRLLHPNAMLDALTISNGYTTSTNARGAGVAATGGQVVNSIIGWGYSAYGGGGVLLDGPVLLSNCTVVANMSDYGGGGIRMTSNCVSAIVADCRIFGNQSTNTHWRRRGGGGIRIACGTVTGCQIASNQAVTANGTGGGISSGEDDFTATGGDDAPVGPVKISNCAIYDNSACKGAGIFLQNDDNPAMITNEIWNCIISYNTASVGATAETLGGGIYLGGTNLIRNSTLRGNQATHGGGAYLVSGAVMRSCLVVSNSQVVSGMFAGGLYLQDNATVESCTIASNTADDGGGIRMVTTNGMMLRNCIAYDNRKADGTAQDIVFAVAGGTNYFYNCCLGTSKLPVNQGNTTNNPLFLNVSSGNFRLSAGSPCINTGMNQAWMTTATDVDGHSRLDRFSQQVDMGAYEFIPAGTLFKVR